MVLAQSAQETDGSGGGVELGDLVCLDDVPVARGRGVDRGALKYGGGDAVEERAVYNVTVAGNPANVGHAGKLVLGMNIKNVFDSKGGAEKVSTGGLRQIMRWSAG